MKKIIIFLAVSLAFVSVGVGQEQPPSSTKLTNTHKSGTHVINGDAYSTGDFEMQQSAVLIIEGNLELGGNLTVPKNAVLVVKRSIDTNSGTNKIRVDGNGALAVLGYKNEKEKLPEGEEAIDNPGLRVYKNNFNGGGNNADQDDVYIYGESKFQGNDAYEAAMNAMAANASLLPVELTFFNVSQKGNEIDFVWKTASETNNNYFTIEYSIDGIEFREITEVDGAGTTSDAHSYNYGWNAEFNGTYYFRLKQTDYNGDYTYSNIVPFSFSRNDMHQLYYQKGKGIMYDGQKMRF